MCKFVSLIGRGGEETAQLICVSDGLFQFVVTTDFPYQVCGCDDNLVSVDPSDGPCIYVGYRFFFDKKRWTVTEIFEGKYGEIYIKAE